MNHDGNLDERLAYFDTEELWFPEWEHGGPYWTNPQAFERHNLGPWYFPTLGVDFLLILDVDYRAVYAFDRTNTFVRGETYPSSPLRQLAMERPAQLSLLRLGGTFFWVAGGTGEADHGCRLRCGYLLGRAGWPVIVVDDDGHGLGSLNPACVRLDRRAPDQVEWV